MVRRELDDTEKQLIAKNRAKLEEERKYREYEVQHADLMITKGLKLNYERQHAEFLVKKRDANERIDLINKQVVVLDEQVRDGVEAKE